MENSNEDFVKSNLVDSILSDMNLNGIFFFNDKNQLNTGIEEEKNGMRTYDFSSLEFGLQDVFAEFRWPSNIDVNCKFQYADKVDQLALLCVSTIQDSNEEKPKNGYLAFSRTIDIEEIKAVTGANFKVSTIPENMTNLISIRKMLNLNKLSSRYVMGVANESQGTMDFSI
ncbi:CHASE4 domain-containing protein [Pseudomonas sp. HK3]